MKKLAGTTWGADQTVLKKLYIERITPLLQSQTLENRIAYRTKQ